MCYAPGTLPIQKSSSTCRSLFEGPGGKPQWKPAATDVVEPGDEAVRMLTADVALLHDPIYRKLVEEYAKDSASLSHDFELAWYKLMSRDVGPATRCRGPLVPPPQPFQNPLPAPPAKLADFKAVKRDVAELLTGKNGEFPGDDAGGKYYGALFVELAWRSASTFRVTDNFGGANGARIRLSPEREWPENVGMDKVKQLARFRHTRARPKLTASLLLLLVQIMGVLASVKSKHATGLSWADLIVLAGQVALEQAGSKPLKFVGGRVDATCGEYVWMRPAAIFSVSSPDNFLFLIAETPLPAATTRTP